MRRLRLTLPWPPSANNIWRNAGRITYLSPLYKRFLSAVFAEVPSQVRNWKAFAGPVRVSIVWNPPTRRAFDIDNKLKPTLDALTRLGVWLDDAQVIELRVTKGPIVKGGQATIEIEEANES